MSTILGYGQTSSGDTTGLSWPILGDTTAIKGKQGLLLQAIAFVLPPGRLQASNWTAAAGYTGPTFLKAIYVFVRDFWDKSLSTPYSGQIFPTGQSQGTTGQIYPF
jgi:hypothetical protein